MRFHLIRFFERSVSPRHLVAASALLAQGCQTDEGYSSEYSCPYTELGTLAADDPGDLGFSANDASAAASVATTGETEPTEEFADSLPVALTHVFTVEDDATIIDFGVPTNPACPEGRALRIPASYEIRGTIGDWSVSATTDLAIVATAARLDAVSTDVTDNRTFWQATVDPDLQAVARSGLPSFVAPDCALTFSLGPLPDDLLAGSWSEELTRGWLSVDCDNYAGDFLDWTSAVVPPPDSTTN